MSYERVGGLLDPPLQQRVGVRPGRRSAVSTLDSATGGLPFSPRFLAPIKEKLTWFDLHPGQLLLDRRDAV